MFAQQGTGKTIISLAILERLDLKFVLIVTPLTSIEVTWLDRLRLQPERYSLHTSFQSFKDDETEKVKVLVLPFRRFSTLSKRLVRVRWCICLLDESQGVKARASAQSRASRRLRRARRRMVLSGTPIDDSPIDVWAQMRFVDHNVLGEDWGPFADKWCNRGGFMNKKWIFRNKLLPQFLKVLEPYIYRLSIDEFGIEKPKLHLVPVALFGEQSRVYRQMEKEGIVRLDDWVIKTDLPITKKIKLEQITGGFIQHNGDVGHIGRAKQRKLDAILPRVKAPVVVSCKFLEELRLIEPILRKHFKRVEILTGAVKDGRTGNHRTQLIKRFQAGEIDALGVQVRTGGVSIEFTQSENLVIYSMNHSRIDFDQLISRLRRFGQIKQVHLFIIYAVNTVDEDIRILVERKIEDAYEVESHFERRVDMAKKPEKKSEKKPSASSKDTVLKLGVADAAKVLDVIPTTVRRMLRDNKIPKAGKTYGWETKEKMMAALKKIKSAAA